MGTLAVVRCSLYTGGRQIAVPVASVPLDLAMRAVVVHEVAAGVPEAAVVELVAEGLLDGIVLPSHGATAFVAEVLRVVVTAVLAANRLRPAELVGWDELAEALLDPG